MTTTTDERRTDPKVASWTHEEAEAITREAYRRLADLVASFGPDDWDRPTDCTAWTVRDLTGHLVGALRSAASLRENLRQQIVATRRTRRHGGLLVDHLTAFQIERAAALDPDGVVAELDRLVEPATRGRRRIPGLLRRRVTFPVDLGHGVEGWNLGWFVDVCLTRDAWLHRIDLCRAVGRDPELTADHDGRIVGDVAEEWLRRHGRAVTLVLTGPAGGRFGSGGEELELDAVEFCRIVSGRAPGTGLLTTEVPF